MIDPQDLKARLMIELETIVEQLVAQQPASDQITLTRLYPFQAAYDKASIQISRIGAGIFTE